MLMYEGKFIDVISRSGWEYVKRKKSRGAVIILAVTENKDLILVRQYRIPLGCLSLEIPAGIIGDIPGLEKEQIEEAAKRELLEETGYEAKTIKNLGKFVSSPGLSSESFTLCKAEDITKVNDGGGDETESIEVIKIPIISVPQYVEHERKKGIAIDAKIFTALHFVN